MCLLSALRKVRQNAADRALTGSNLVICQEAIKKEK